MKKRLLLIISIFLILANVSYAVINFNDITTDQWYYTDLNYVVNESRGILKGYTDGSFKPKDEITVEEFIKCIIVAADLPIENATDKKWSTPYINKAIEKEYIFQESFDAYNRAITRGEMAKIISRSLEDISGPYAFRDESVLANKIKDYDTFDEILAASIIKTYDIGIIGGYPDGEFKPNNLLSRAEGVTVIRRLIDDSSRLKHNLTNSESQTQIIVSTIEELNAAEDMTSKGDLLILIEDGTYVLNDQFVIQGENVTIRSYSGNAKNVIVKGKGMYGNVPHVFSVYASNFTVEDLTLGWVRNHGIQVHGEMDVDNFTAKNVHIRDTYEQMIKVSKDVNRSYYSDNGLIENCTFKYTDGTGPQYYIGGVDAHRARNWVIRNNTFSSIKYPQGRLTEGAIHFWSNSEGTLIEKNTIYDCDRGIMLGLDNSPHYDGIVKNNFVVANRDVGIYVCESENTQVFNNTIFIDSSYPNAIEYRFNTTGSEIINNLSNKKIIARNGAAALVRNNLEDALKNWFVNVTIGDLHLSKNTESVIDTGEKLEGVLEDIDGDTRELFDIGADER